MPECPTEWHSSERPAPRAASNSTKTKFCQTPRTPRICRGNISGQKRCRPRLHTSWHRSSPATATFEQNGSPQDLPTVESGKKPRRSSAAPQSTDILCAEFPSSPESSKSITTAGPTRSPAPAPPPHPPRRTGYRRSRETASPSSILLAADQEAPPRADPAKAPVPAPAAPESAQAIAQCACRTGTPRQRKTTPARAALSRLCTHSPAKSSPSSSTLCALFFVSSVLSSFRNFQLSTINRLFPEQRNYLPTQFHHALQRPRRHPDNLLEQTRHGRQKLQHAFHSFARVRIAAWICFHFLHTFRQHMQRRIDLPPLPFLGDDPENLPHVLDRFKMVAPVPQHVNHPHNPPALQLPQTGAHIRARHRQRGRYLVRRHRPRR